MMQEIAGYELKVKINPLFVRPNEIYSLAGSTEKLKSIIDIPPVYSLKNTLVKMYES